MGGGAPGSRHEPACISQRPSAGGALGAQVLLGRVPTRPRSLRGAPEVTRGAHRPRLPKAPSQDGLRLPCSPPRGAGPPSDST